MQDKTAYDQTNDISSPTVSTTSIFSTVAVAAAKGYAVMTFDIGTAYLNADMKGTVRMRLDPISARILCQIDDSYKQFLEPDGSMVVSLNKALYGCVESARLWYEHLKIVMKKMQYEINPLDPCVFNKKDSTGSILATVCFHVDDGLATALEDAELELLRDELVKEFGEVTFRTGEVHEYLGIKIDLRRKLQAEMTMKDYTLGIVKPIALSSRLATTCFKSTRPADCWMLTLKSYFIPSQPNVCTYLSGLDRTFSALFRSCALESPNLLSKMN
jgi:hypothetical protein